MARLVRTGDRWAAATVAAKSATAERAVVSNCASGGDGGPAFAADITLAAFCVAAWDHRRPSPYRQRPAMKKVHGWAVLVAEPAVEATELVAASE